MNSIFEYFQLNPVVDLLGWTLIHFLWQALVVAAVVFSVSTTIKRTNATLRYWLFASGMFGLLVCPLVTSWYLLPVAKRQDNQMAGAVTTVVVRSFVTSTGDTMPIAEAVDAFDRAMPSLETSGETEVVLQPIATLVGPWIPWLVGVWIAGVIFHVARLCAGLIRVQRWRSQAQVIDDGVLYQAFETLKSRMNIHAARIAETQALTGAAVVGIWKPLVLVPTSMLVGLSVKEMELVLAHELAHIHRHDYLVNLCQRVVESLFFFHPAVWLISRQISVEREHCCDEMAAELCGDRIALAKALTAMETIRCRESLAVAASGGALSKRIQRLLAGDPVPSGSPWSMGLVLATLVGALLWLVLPFVGDVSIAEASHHDIELPNESVERKELAVASPDDEIVPMSKQESLKKDPATGIDQRVFENIRMTVTSESAKTETGVDLKYSNVIPYTFIPRKIAKSLKATKLGTIDFSKHVPATFPEKLVGVTKPKPMEEPSTTRLTVYVNEVTDVKQGREIVPFPTDAIWVPAHLGFYGMNKNKQSKFDVVRIDKIDIGIGETFGPLNVLVLDDENSAFGLMGRQCVAKVRGKNGERLWHLAATGEFQLLKRGKTKKKKADTPAGLERGKNDENEIRHRPLRTPSANKLNRALVEIESGNGKLQHISYQALDVGRTATELLKHFSSVIEKHGSPMRMDSITNMESIVSAQIKSRNGDCVVAQEVLLNLPEGSKARVSLIGDSIQLTRNDRSNRVVIENGKVQWIDSVGVIRAEASVVANAGKLLVETKVDLNEVVMKISGLPDDKGIEDSARPSVQVNMNAATGAPKNEQQSPHRSVRYDIRDADGGKAMRMKMMWRYDMARLAKEAEAESGKSWTQIIYGDDAIDVKERDATKKDTSQASPAIDLPWHATGKVTDEQGNPLQGVAVTAHSGIGTLFRTGEATTGANGRFDFRFGPGVHSSNKRMVQAATISVKLAGHVEKDLHRQGDLVAALEKPNEIGWGGKTEEQLFLPGKTIELHFVMVKSVLVKGRIFGDNGKPLAGMKVSLRGHEMPPSQSGAAFATTDEQGRYKMSDVPANYSYQILVRPKKRGHPWLAWASAPITFLNGKSEGTHIKYVDNGSELDFSCQNLDLHLQGDGENWKLALSNAGERDLELKWDGLSSGNQVRAGAAWVTLGK